MAWVEADVHAWSGRMREALQKEMPELVLQSVEAENRFDFIHKDVIETYPTLVNVIAKIIRRFGIRDNDLCGVSPLGLLVIAWERVDKKALGLMLADIGQTCLQGDSHRLFSLILAHQRSLNGSSTCRDRE